MTVCAPRSASTIECETNGPLLAQIERRTPGLFAVDYLERGPQDWRLQFVHRG